MIKVWQPSRWYFNPAKRRWCLSKTGEYDVGEMPETELEIDAEDIRKLITALDEEGWIKPRLDERLRSEDLKIINRLLDIIEKKLRSG